MWSFYPSRIDNYCKIVKSLKYYGRYMDDIYIIHPDKKYLQQLLLELKEIADELGLVINMKKTRICKIDRTFTYLKIKYTLLEDGTIVKKLHRDSIVRERRRLKNMLNLIFHIKRLNRHINLGEVMQLSIIRIKVLKILMLYMINYL